jgi:competence protein ComEC
MAASESIEETARGKAGASLAGRGAKARALFGRLRKRAQRWAAGEAGRLALWAPVALGAGAGLYFALKSEPPFWLGVSFLIAAAVSWAVSSAGRRKWAGAAFLIAAGFVAADIRTAGVAAPVIARELSPRDIAGRLVSVEESAEARRLIIEVASIARFSEPLPGRVRVTWRGDEFAARPGDMIAIRAGLSPPPPPAAPGAFDFARQLFFERIGAVGYAVSAPQKIAAAKESVRDRLAAAIESARLSLARRILDKAPGEGGAIVAAVVTGKRGAVSERSQAALRDSGLAHLLAISGLHMGLATGLIFFAVRFGLALAEPLALRFPIKKWAAAAALAAGFAYLLLSGGGWSARRAFIMTSIVFIAILADRRGLSLRNVAVAATIILLTTPEAVLHPGFQMSFAAVTALIAAYEWAGARADPDRSFSALARLKRYLVGIAVTDSVAATATAPYSLFHFHRVALYSLAGNIAAAPLMGLWVMPMAIAALVLAPLGADGWAWRASAAGVDAILKIGGAVASQPGAVATIAAAPASSLVILTIGGLWLCLQKEMWRLGGLATIPLALVFVSAQRPPDIFVSHGGDNAGIVVEGADGAPALALFNPRKDRFVAGVWKETVGLDKERALTLALAEVAACDPAGCVAHVKGAVVAMSADPLGLADDCKRADLVIALYPVRRATAKRCQARLIERFAAWDDGSHAAWIGKGGEIRIRSAAEARGRRPWTDQ